MFSTKKITLLLALICSSQAMFSDEVIFNTKDIIPQNIAGLELVHIPFKIYNGRNPYSICTGIGIYNSGISALWFPFYVRIHVNTVLIAAAIASWYVYKKYKQPMAPASEKTEAPETQEAAH